MQESTEVGSSSGCSELEVAARTQVQNTEIRGKIEQTEIQL
jgi:hypothetical protein